LNFIKDYRKLAAELKEKETAVKKLTEKEEGTLEAVKEQKEHLDHLIV
jgi:hypothetical protein